MEKQNITSKHPQSPETTEVASNVGACFVIDDNPENKDGGCDVASDSSGSSGTIVYSEMYSTSENESPEDRKACVILDYEPEDNIKGEHSAKLNSLSQKDSTDGRSVTAGGTSDDRYVVSTLTPCAIPHRKLKVRFRNTSPTDSDKNQSGYESDVDYSRDGESSGNVTDSDTESKKTLAEKSKHAIEKAIERLDAIKEDIAEFEAQNRPDDEPEEYEEDIDDEPGSSCTDTMVETYDSTDFEVDTGIPRHILYKLQGREDKPRPEKRKGSKNTKRKLSTEDA
ncbi:hypothetical protein JTE90_004867 [Oedothorax gibbosus]|uniref:Uncharacterized protein n=1 Tax=Oedothorax gibbosus TaxID=931172 RepID=A0AAV6UUA7_9ARAC|nr:hypothetical protein JTE90_004867 [Oedothorax gibbosus]